MFKRVNYFFLGFILSFLIIFSAWAKPILYAQNEALVTLVLEDTKCSNPVVVPLTQEQYLSQIKSITGYRYGSDRQAVIVPGCYLLDGDTVHIMLENGEGFSIPKSIFSPTRPDKIPGLTDI
jgi:hypothetical protein